MKKRKQIFLASAVIATASSVIVFESFNTEETIDVVNKSTTIENLEEKLSNICVEDKSTSIVFKDFEKQYTQNFKYRFENKEKNNLTNMPIISIYTEAMKDNSFEEDMIENYIEKKFASLEMDSLKKTNEIANKFLKGKTGIPTKEELNQLSAIYSIPENLMYSLMLKESEGIVNALSHKNAKGLFQFLPETARQFGLIVNDEIDERTSIWKSADASARYLAWIFTYLHPEKDRSNLMNYKYVLAGYNAGISNVKKGGSLKIPNFKETINYVEKIIGHAKGDLYLVQRGDRLKDIATVNNVDFVSLKKMNKGITQEKLIAGRYLLINKASFDNLHVVNKGDSLYGIARTYQVDLNELMIVNNLTSNLIGIGQKIKIPF